MPPPSPVIRIALVGFGRLGQEVYAPLLRRTDSIEVTIIADPASHCRSVAQLLFPKSEISGSPEAAVASEKCDAVMIAAPPWAHAELALLALQSGKHVYLEKPMTIASSEAERLADAWRESGLVGMMGFNYRFTRAVQSLRRQLRAGRAGRVRAIQSVFSLSSGNLPVWKQSRRTGGGALLDLGPHHIDLFRYLFDTEVETTRARIWSERTEEDCATVQMTLADGTDVQSFFSLCATDQDVIKVHGETGTMVIDRYGSDRIQFESLGKRRSGLRRLAGSVADFLPTPCLWRKLRAPWHEPSYAIALQQFIRAIGREPGVSYPDFDDGWRCQEIIEAAEESSRTAQPVEGRSATIP